MSNAVIVDQILRRPTSYPKGWATVPEASSNTYRIGSINVSLGDSTVGPTCWTGGLVPYARIHVPDDSAAHAHAAVVVLRTTNLAGASLGAFATLVSTTTPDARPDFSFRVFAAYASEGLSQTTVVQRVAEGLAASSAESTGAVAGASSPTKALVHDIASHLPRWSQARLARLVGVSRQTWRDWATGRTEARYERRARLVQIAHILKTRMASARENPANWFEAPLWPGRPDTPEFLASEGRIGLVSAMALRVPTRTVTSRFGEMTGGREVEQDLKDASTIYAVPSDDE